MAKWLNATGLARVRDWIRTNFALKTDIPTVPTKVSDLTNDSGFITSSDVVIPTASSSVKGGVMVGSRLSISNGILSANIQTDNNFTTAHKNKLDGIADSANNYSLPTASSAVKGGVKIGAGLTMTGEVLSADAQSVPTKTSDLTNDSGFITTETDPTVPAWAKASSKPSYTAQEVGALPSTYTPPVTSVNSQTGDVVIPNATVSADGLLSASDKSKLDGLPLAAYPVGSYYWGEDSTSPATKFGGTWTQITTGGAIVLEQGTSNIWTYRKFSDGVAECWGETSYAVTEWVSFGSLSEANPGHYINYPSDLFIAAPIFNVTPGVYDGAVILIETYTGNSATRTPTMYGMRPDSGGGVTRVVIRMHAIGAWRNQHTPFYLWVRTA